MTTSLTIDRLFDAPALAGPTVQALKISPDNSRVTFLRGKDSDKDRLDLWEYHLASGVTRVLVDADELAPRTEPTSDEELGRRERQRTAALSGILEYQFAPAGDALLFPLAGELYFHRLAARAGEPTTERIPSSGFPTDPTISPDGSRIAYIQAQNIVCYDLKDRVSRQLTTDGGDAIKNGMAEFVAQEEMDRDTGYWWSPDARHIAYTRVDESGVAEVQRFEVSADHVRTFAQRYPAAGASNATVRVGVLDISSGKTVWLDTGPDPDIYIARVNWLPDARTVAIQRQSRDQKQVELLFADISTGQSRVVISESSATWIDLHHELTFLKQRAEFIWASSRDGFTHLYLYEISGRLIRQLTQGPWVVDDFRSRAIKAVDEARGQVYFTATMHSPTERRLYRVDLGASGSPIPVTTLPGVHSISMASDSSCFVDSFQCDEHPPKVGIFNRDARLIAWLLENPLDASHPDAPYLSSNALSTFGMLTAEDGQALHYRLFKPHNFDPARLYPAIIDVYGGPGVQRVLNTWSGSAFTQILTRAGFVVMQIDNRGSAHRGVAFQAPIYGQLGTVEVADQVLGARWLASQPYIDASRLGVWGWSYGGYLTLMLLFKAPDLFKAGVSGAPVTDWALYDTHYTERYLGRPQENPGHYAASSTLPFAKDLKAALLLMHGLCDDNVLVTHTTQLMLRLQQSQTLFELMLYPGAKHGLLRQRDGRHGYRMILDFFSRTLLAS